MKKKLSFNGIESKLIVEKSASSIRRVFFVSIFIISAPIGNDTDIEEDLSERTKTNERTKFVEDKWFLVEI